MRVVFRLIGFVGTLFLAACTPKDEPAPMPEKSRAEIQREEFFGAEAAADKAVTWKPTGLGVKILQPGEGRSPELGDKVTVRYTGRLKDGTIFDGTADDKTAEFAIERMIPGLAAGLPALKPGGRALFYIPPSLGYGAMRVGKIPPVSGLIFEVELVRVGP